MLSVEAPVTGAGHRGRQFRRKGRTKQAQGFDGVNLQLYNNACFNRMCSLRRQACPLHQLHQNLEESLPGLVTMLPGFFGTAFVLRCPAPLPSISSAASGRSPAATGPRSLAPSLPPHMPTQAQHYKSSLEEVQTNTCWEGPLVFPTLGLPRPFATQK